MVRLKTNVEFKLKIFCYIFFSEKMSIKPINYKEYPECMFAILAAFLPRAEGNDLRRVAGDVVFRSTDRDGRTYRNGLLHSYEDEPAIIADNGTYKVWYKQGKIHREGDLPAITRNEQYQEWYRNGRLHRDRDLPAIIGTNFREWYKNGKLHRDGDQPAVIDLQLQLREWWVNGIFIKSERDNEEHGDQEQGDEEQGDEEQGDEEQGDAF
jgi:hypothetical protein